MARYTLQEIFDKSTHGVIRQGDYSYALDDRCYYRGPNGLMCAAGHLADPERISRTSNSSRSIR